MPKKRKPPKGGGMYPFQPPGGTGKPKGRKKPRVKAGKIRRRKK